MKKFLIGLSAIGLSVALTACGTSPNDAAINGLSKQLDDTSNTLSEFSTVNPTDLSMSKDTLSALATNDNSIYDNIIGTQQSLLNEQYYKTDILNRTAKIKSCLSKDLSLSKAQISAVKDLTNNLAKYTNSVSYTKSELNSAIKSVSSMKKNPNKNYDKISAKLNRIACNSNTRMAYYENIINTLNQLENFLCCENCNENLNKNLNGNNQNTLTEENENTTTSQNSTKIESTKENSTQNSATNQTNTTENSKEHKGLPINIDTYAPTNRNIDTMPYGSYNNRFGYARGYGYNGYGAGIYNNGYGFNGANGVYGYGMRGYPAYGYGMGYNSNNINRAYGVPVSEIKEINTQNLPQERIEDFEEIKDGQLQKIDSKTQNPIPKAEKSVEINLNKQNEQQTKTTSNTIENISSKVGEKAKNTIENAGEKVAETTKNVAEKVLNASAKEFKKIKPAQDNRTTEEIQKDLNQPIIAHEKTTKTDNQV